MISERPIIGQLCWAKPLPSYPLPEGLLPRTPILIISIVYFEVIARDEQGREWELCTINVDAGQVAWLDGERCHESHPSFAHYLLNWLGELQRRRDMVHPNQAWRKEDISSQIANVRWILERNHYDPDASLPAGPVPEATGTPKGPRHPVRLPLPANLFEFAPRRMTS